MKKTALTIAGSDCSGGAGIQADIKTMEANGVYAMSVISVLTAQNTLGVQKLFPVSAECITAQIDSVFADIFPDVPWHRKAFHGSVRSRSGGERLW